jgi:hypothetical protein
MILIGVYSGLFFLVFFLQVRPAARNAKNGIFFLVAFSRILDQGRPFSPRLQDQGRGNKLFSLLLRADEHTISIIGNRDTEFSTTRPN